MPRHTTSSSSRTRAVLPLGALIVVVLGAGLGSALWKSGDDDPTAARPTEVGGRTVTREPTSSGPAVPPEEAEAITDAVEESGTTSGGELENFAFTTSAGTCEHPCTPPTRVVVVVGGAVAELPAGGSAADRFPRWSPDGTRLAFTRIDAAGAGELYVVDATANAVGEPRRLTDTAGQHGGRGCVGLDMAGVWSHDGRRLAFACAGGPSASLILLASVEGPADTVAVPVGAEHVDSDPSMAGDGLLAFARRNVAMAFGEPGRVTVWTARVEGDTVSPPAPLAGTTGDEPAWAPGGGRLAFVERNERTLDVSLRVRNLADGAERTYFTAGGQGVEELYAVAWSPDGARLAFTAGDGVRTSTVHVVDLASGEVRKVSPEGAMAFAPAWSPGGTLLAFDVVGSDGLPRLTLHEIATGTARELPLPADAFDIAWRPLAPAA